MENELELQDLKEIAIAKIKAAYNHSVDLEANHSVLWDRFAKIRKIKLSITLILSLIAASSLIFTITFINLTDIRNYLFLADIFALIIAGLIIWEVIFAFKGKLEDHGQIVNGALRLREMSIGFLQYKLDNLDKKGYIDELKSLEINDSNLTKKSARYTKNLSKKVKSIVNDKIEDLEKQGIKKYFVIQEKIDSATKKLQKFTALRTCEAWIKFT
ncbi:MAG TPA: hypothetical protein ENH75_11650 [archaeon]|nr:hypothetical protein [archaeon]